MLLVEINVGYLCQRLLASTQVLIAELWLHSGGLICTLGTKEPCPASICRRRPLHSRLWLAHYSKSWASISAIKLNGAANRI